MWRCVGTSNIVRELLITLGVFGPREKPDQLLTK